MISKEPKHINEMTKSQFKELPIRDWDEDIGEFDSLVILPGNSEEIHESGYRLIDFVACIKQRPICRLSGCSDVLHIGGIAAAIAHDTGGWMIDCLSKSGLVRLRKYDTRLTVGMAVSSFEVFAK